MFTSYPFTILADVSAFSFDGIIDEVVKARPTIEEKTVCDFKVLTVDGNSENHLYCNTKNHNVKKTHPQIIFAQKISCCLEPVSSSSDFLVKEAFALCTFIYS